MGLAQRIREEMEGLSELEISNRVSRTFDGDFWQTPKLFLAGLIGSHAWDHYQNAGVETETMAPEYAMFVMATAATYVGYQIFSGVKKATIRQQGRKILKERGIGLY